MPAYVIIRLWLDFQVMCTLEFDPYQFIRGIRRNANLLIIFQRWQKKSPPPLIARQIRPSTARNTSLSKKKYICSYVCCWLLRPFLAFGFHAASYHVSQCYLWPLYRAHPFWGLWRGSKNHSIPFGKMSPPAITEMNRPSQVLGEKASWVFGLYFV